MNFKIEPNPQEMRAAAMVAETAQLAGVRVSGIIAENRIDMNGEPEALRSEIGFGLDRYVPSETGMLIVEVNLQALICPATAADKPLLKDVADCPDGCARIEIGLVGEYRIPEGKIPDVVMNDGLPAFARINGLYNCWPYFRQQLQYITMNMGLPPFVLAPLLVRVRKETDAAE